MTPTAHKKRRRRQRHAFSGQVLGKGVYCLNCGNPATSAPHHLKFFRCTLRTPLRKGSLHQIGAGA